MMMMTTMMTMLRRSSGLTEGRTQSPESADAVVLAVEASAARRLLRLTRVGGAAPPTLSPMTKGPRPWHIYWGEFPWAFSLFFFGFFLFSSKARIGKRIWEKELTLPGLLAENRNSYRRIEFYL